MKELVFLLEEPSARAMLEGLLPRLGVALPATRFMVFEGKSDLERQVTRRIRGYLNPEARFIVVRDQDAAPDCRSVKARLAEMCRAGGRPEALVRIFCRELESLYLADLSAVERALGIPGLADRQREARFRAPDAVVSPSRELATLTRGRYQKIGGSRAIGPLLDVDNARSPSFRALVSGIRRLCSDAPEGP